MTFAASAPKSTVSKSWWVDLLAFALALALAWWLDWHTSDLIWSLWLSSLLLGYLTILYALYLLVHWLWWLAAKIENREITTEDTAKLTQAYYAEAYAAYQARQAAQRESESEPAPEKSAAAPSMPGFGLPAPLALRVLAIGAGTFMLGFFSLHFCGFHAIHASLLHDFFPIETVSQDSFFDNAIWPPGLLAMALTKLAPIYGWFLLAALLSERQHIFAGLRPRGDTPPLAVADGLKQVPMNLFLRPYLNVIRMHLLIFFFFGVHLLGWDHFGIFAVVYAFYFFPWSIFWKKKTAETV